MIQERKDAEVTLTDTSDFHCRKLTIKIFFFMFLHLSGSDIEAKMEGEIFTKE